MYKLRKTTGDGINNDNPTKKILNAIIAVLDLYFQWCAAEMAEQLKESGEILRTHVLWDLKQTEKQIDNR